jgi:small subunit ribosomal protein S11
MNCNLVINITPNNIVVAINTLENKTVACISSGQIVPKLKGRKKVSYVAAELIAALVVKKLKTKKCSFINIFFGGVNRKRKTMIREFLKYGIKISKIEDFTGVPHNGCRLKKQRRK